jgi:hypothetical protein
MPTNTMKNTAVRVGPRRGYGGATCVSPLIANQEQRRRSHGLPHECQNVLLNVFGGFTVFFLKPGIRLLRFRKNSSHAQAHLYNFF